MNLEENQESKDIDENDNDDNSQLDIVEIKAAEKGWKPQEAWKGKPEDWRPAKEFLDRESFFTKIKDQNRQISELKQTLKGLADHQSKIALIERENAIKELKVQKKEALENSDHDKVMEIDDQIAAVKSAPAPQQLTNSPPQDTEFEGFKERNAWYEEDTDLKEMAESLATSYFLSNKDNFSFKAMYDYVEKKMQKVIDKQNDSSDDEDKSSRTEKKGSPVSKPSAMRNNAKPSKSKFTFNDLNSDQKRVAERYVRAGAFKTVQEYVDDLGKMGELG